MSGRSEPVDQDVILKELDHIKDKQNQQGRQLGVLTDAVTRLARLEERQASQGDAHARTERQIDEVWGQLRSVGEQAYEHHSRHIEQEFRPLQHRVHELEVGRGAADARWGIMDKAFWKLLVPLAFIIGSGFFSWFAATQAVNYAVSNQPPTVEVPDK